MTTQNTLLNKTVLITGAARRIGAQTIKTLHAAGANIILHYRSSKTSATELADALNQSRPNSVQCLQADLLDLDSIQHLAEQSTKLFNRLDVLVNNASTFYPTPIGEMSEEHYNDLFGSNIKAPLFLSQACAPYLKESQGCIINIVDIHARSPLKNHTIYSCAKAANAMLVRSLAKELGPQVRVNGVAPGAILWPENEAELDDATQQQILSEIPLKRAGNPNNIADTVLFLAQHDYINGQIIAIDGGRQLF